MTELGQNLIDALALGSLYALIALGITLVYTVMGMMNFAHGEFIMLAAYALFVFAGLPFAAAVGGALLAGIAIALLAERVAFRPVRNADLSAQLVTSLAVAAILQNVVTAAVDARAQSVADAGLAQRIDQHRQPLGAEPGVRHPRADGDRPRRPRLAALPDPHRPGDAGGGGELRHGAPARRPRRPGDRDRLRDQRRARRRRSACCS